MPFRFTKEQRKKAQKDSLALVGFCVDARHCKPAGIKIELSGSPLNGDSLARAKTLFLAALKNAYSDRLKANSLTKTRTRCPRSKTATTSERK